MQDNLIISLGLTNWLSVPSNVKVNTLQSREFGVLMMGERMVPSGVVGLGFGLGFSSQNVHSDAMLIHDTDSLVTYFEAIPKERDMKVNKISLNFIDAQLEVRIHTKPNTREKHFKLSAGIKGGILVQSHRKYKDKMNNYKTSGLADLNKYQYGLIARVGYGNFAIGGYYSMVEIFKDKKGPELTPYTLGLYMTL
jgi:hypothetical protein